MRTVTRSARTGGLYSNGQMRDYRVLGLLETHRALTRDRLGGCSHEED